MPVTIRAEVAEAVRKAAGLIYVQSEPGMTYAWLAAQLDSEAVDADVIARWAEEDCWEERRNKVFSERIAAAPTPPPPSNAAKRAEACLKAVETLHNSAVIARRQLRPKSWEQAAMVQLRCAEALRHWSHQDEAKDAASKSTADTGKPPAIPADSVFNEEQWQDLAHVALKRRNEREKEKA